MRKSGPDVPPGYDPALAVDAKPKTKAAKRNERRKEKRQQAGPISLSPVFAVVSPLMSWKPPDLVEWNWLVHWYHSCLCSAFKRKLINGVGYVMQGGIDPFSHIS